MRDEMREQLKVEITRKQFLQYMTAAALMVFGLDNLISLLTGHKIQKHILIQESPEANHGFGTSRFGV